MATSMRRLPSGEHVMVQRQTLRNERLEEEVPNRGQIMGLGVQGAIVTVRLLCSFEPWLGMEGLRLIPVIIIQSGRNSTSVHTFDMHLKNSSPLHPSNPQSL